MKRAIVCICLILLFSVVFTAAAENTIRSGLITKEGSVTLILDAGNGQFENGESTLEITIDDEDEIDPDEFEEPVRDGYEFVGWEESDEEEGRWIAQWEESDEDEGFEDEFAAAESDEEYDDAFEPEEYEDDGFDGEIDESDEEESAADDLQVMPPLSASASPDASTAEEQTGDESQNASENPTNDATDDSSDGEQSDDSDEGFEDDDNEGKTDDDNDRQRREFDRFDRFDIREYRMPETGFSAVTPVALSIQTSAYVPQHMSLQFPTLDVLADIVLAPQKDDSWEIEWLGKNAGLLEGSALPGEGNAYIAAHNHLNTTEAGPFALLVSLEKGDRVMLTDEDGELQIFEVYANEKIASDDSDALYEQSVAFEDSLTFITCEDETVEGSYACRRIVSAKPVN